MTATCEWNSASRCTTPIFCSSVSFGPKVREGAAAALSGGHVGFSGARAGFDLLMSRSLVWLEGETGSHRFICAGGRELRGARCAPQAPTSPCKGEVDVR